MKYDNSIEARKKRKLYAREVGSIISEAPYFVEGMSDYDLEQEHDRFMEYWKEHGITEGFEPMKITE